MNELMIKPNEKIPTEWEGKWVDASFGPHSAGRVMFVPDEVTTPNENLEVEFARKSLEGLFELPSATTTHNSNSSEFNTVKQKQETLKQQEEIRILNETPVTSAALGDFHDEIKNIKTEINNSKKPEKQGFFAKIGNSIGNSLNNFKHDVQNGLLGASIGNVLGIKQVHQNRTYAELNEQVAELQALANSVADPAKKQEILNRINKLTGNITNTAKTLDLISKQTGEPIENIAKNAIYDRYENTQNIIEARKKGLKTLGFFALGLFTGGTGNALGAALGFAGRVGAAGLADRNKIENKKTEEYRREELANATPKLVEHLNTIKQQVLEGKFSENGIKELLGNLQDLLVIQEGKLSTEVETQMLDLSSVLYEFLGSNDKQISEPEAIEKSHNFKSFIDNLRVTIDPDIAKQVVQELHKDELNKATMKAVAISGLLSGAAIGGGFIFRHIMENGGVDPKQAVENLTGKLKNGIEIQGNAGHEGIAFATHDNSPETLAQINKSLGSHYTSFDQVPKMQTGELTVYGNNISGITPDELQNSLSKAVIPDTEDLFRPDNIKNYSDNIKLIKPDHVNGDNLIFDHNGHQISFAPGSSGNLISDHDLRGVYSVVGKDANGDLILANTNGMSAEEMSKLGDLMEQPGARYFAEQANIKDFFGIGDTQGLGGEALRKQAVASVGSSDPVAITKEMFRIRAEANIGGENAEVFANAQMQALKEATGSNYEQFVTAAASGREIPANPGLTNSMYERLLGQFPQYKTFIIEQAKWTNVGEGIGLQSVLDTATEGNNQTIPTSNFFTPVNDWINKLPEPYKTMATTGIIGASWGAGVGTTFGLVKGIRNAENGFVNKVVGGAKGAGTGFVKGTVTGGLFGAGAGFVGPMLGVTGANLATGAAFAGGGAELGRRMTPILNPGNNFMNRLIGGRPTPAQAPANATPNQPLTQEQQNAINADINNAFPDYAQILNGTDLVTLRQCRDAVQTNIANIETTTDAQRTPQQRFTRERFIQMRTALDARIAQLQTQNQQGGGEGEGGNEGRELTEATFGRFAQQMRDYRNTLQPRLENVTTRERLLANDVERRRVVGELNQHLNTTRRYANAIRDRRLNLNDANERTLQGINRWTREALTTLDYEPRINRITALINSNGERDQDNVDDNLERIVGAMLEVQEELNRNVERGIRVEQSELLLEDIENNIQALRDRFGYHDIDDIIDEIEVGGIGVPDAA